MGFSIPKEKEMVEQLQYKILSRKNINKYDQYVLTGHEGQHQYFFSHSCSFLTNCSNKNQKKSFNW